MAARASSSLPTSPTTSAAPHATRGASPSFLTVAVDGKMVPWDRIPFKDYEDKPGAYDKLVEQLAKMKLTVSLGAHEGYFLLAVGESTESLAKLGKGKSLAGRAEMKPLSKF